MSIFPNNMFGWKEIKRKKVKGFGKIRDSLFGQQTKRERMNL